MDRVTPWLIGKIEELRPAGKPDLGIASELGRVVEVIWGRTGMVFGMVVGNIDRDAVLARGVDVMTAWLPHLPLGMLRSYGEVARKTSLPIDITPYLANAQRIDDEIAAAREAAEAAKRAAFVQRKADAASKEPRNPELEAALGDDDDAYSVYADWLESHGSVRGELIQRMLEDADVDAFIAEHATELIGVVPANSDEEMGVGEYTLTWRRGFIDKLELSSFDGVRAGLEHFLEHPSGRRIRSIAIGMNGEPDPDEPHGEIVASIVREQPPHLTELHLGAFDPDRCDISSYAVGDVSMIWQGLPTLRTVRITGGSFELGAIEAPQLERLELRTGGLTAANVQSIATAAWPSLRHLDVCFGDHNYGGDTELADVETLLETDYPALRHLGLMNCPFADEAVGVLVDSKLLAQLESLDLSLGCLGDAGAELLLANQAQLRNLARLDVSASYLGPQTLRALGQLGIELIAEDMNGAADPDDRYVAISE
jgi:uncharacterized protein (TIGR02996 family)